MRYTTAIFSIALLCPLAAKAGLLEPSQIDAARLLPPPPGVGSVEEKAEFSELRAIAARSTPQMRAVAKHDAEDETPDIFNAAIGFDIATRPQTFKLLDMVVEEEDGDTKGAKAFFHRERPYSTDPSLKTCTPVKPGKAANSYPSGHASLAFSMGVVLASLMPEKSQAILARSAEYAERRLVCGVHFRSDIVAGQQFGTVLALRLMQNPQFQAQMKLARAELAGG
jgi:membrane-associated phospholipid phosphatase